MEEFKTARVLLGFTQTELAEFLNCTLRTIQRWEKAETVPLKAMEKVVNLLLQQETEVQSLVAMAKNMPANLIIYEKKEDSLFKDSPLPLGYYNEIARRAFLSGKIKLVVFDKENYQSFLGEENDTLEKRAEWAAMQN